MFYIEPSELGFHLALIIIMLMYLIIKEKDSKVNRIYIIYLINCTFLLVLSQAYGASVMLLLTIFIVSFVILLTKMNYKNILIGYGVTIIFTVTIILFIATKSSIYMRTIDTIDGSDSSNSYRVNVTEEFTRAAVANTNGIGVGLGNLNTDRTRKIFMSTGMTAVVAASFPYFIAEGGIFAILYSLLLTIFLGVNVIFKKNILLASLLIFMFLYQIYGGYFTNPVNWFVYGLILSRWTPDRIQEENNIDVGKGII